MDFSKILREKFKKNSPGLSPGIISLILCILIFTGCASRTDKVVKDNEIEMKLMEKRLSLMEKKLDKIYSRLSIIQFMVDNHEQMLKTSSNIQGIIESPKKEETRPEVSRVTRDSDKELTPEELYSKGIRLINEKKYNLAIIAFDKFLMKYPEDKLADNALYWKGESFYTQKKFNESVKIFEEVTKKYPDGSKYPDALLKAGYSYIGIGEKEKAKEMLRNVIKLYPFSNAAPKAEAKLKELL